MAGEVDYAYYKEHPREAFYDDKVIRHVFIIADHLYSNIHLLLYPNQTFLQQPRFSASPSHLRSALPIAYDSWGIRNSSTICFNYFCTNHALNQYVYIYIYTEKF